MSAMFPLFLTIDLCLVRRFWSEPASVWFLLPTMSNLLNFTCVLMKLKLSSVNIDNVFFRLHYKLTVTIFLGLSLLVISRQLMGDPIDCQFPDLPDASLNTFCQYVSVRDFPMGAEDRPKVFDYYEWVFIALLTQGILFYMPHYTWKVWEGGRMKMLAMNLVSPVLSPDYVERDVKPLVEYISSQLHSHNSYAYKYFICEVFNCTNVVLQICFMRSFIDGGFRYYGIHAAISNEYPTDEDTTNPMEQIFPTISKCTYRTYNTFGEPKDFYGFCVLNQNSSYQKIYIFLWFWCHMLAVISVLVVIFRAIILLSSRARFFEFRFNDNVNSAEDLEIVHQKLWVGDWFLLMMLRSNLNPLAYRELVFRLAQRFARKS